MRPFGSWALLLWLLLFSGAVFADILADPIVHHKEVGQGYERVTFTNTCAVPVSIKLSLTLDNVSVKGPSTLIELSPFVSVVGPTFTPKDPKSAWKYNWTYRYNFGVVGREPSSQPFALPWAIGESRKTGQSFGGERSHFGEDFYAVDFAMEEGTPIHAARPGLVCYVRDHYREGGWRPELRDKDNHVMIAHEDGTMSRYLHLRENGAEVELGQWVEAGELIGYSGNVGFSSGPHLHFDVVRLGSDLITRTVPFQFLSHGVVVTPREEMILGH